MPVARAHPPPLPLGLIERLTSGSGTCRKNVPNSVDLFIGKDRALIGGGQDGIVKHVIAKLEDVFTGCSDSGVMNVLQARRSAADAFFCLESVLG